MTYWNPVERYGVDRFAADLAGAGGAGLITPDLTPDEAGEWMTASDAHGLDRIFLVAPSSTDERLAMTAEASSGFVYATSVMGVTGQREQTSSLAPTLVERLRSVTDKPVGVGLGVSNRARRTRSRCSPMPSSSAPPSCDACSTRRRARVASTRSWSWPASCAKGWTDDVLGRVIPSPSSGVWHLGPVPLRAYAFGIIIGALLALWIGEKRFTARGGRGAA